MVAYKVLKLIAFRVPLACSRISLCHTAIDPKSKRSSSSIIIKKEAASTLDKFDRRRALERGGDEATEKVIKRL